MDNRVPRGETAATQVGLGDTRTLKPELARTAAACTLEQFLLASNPLLDFDRLLRSLVPMSIKNYWCRLATQRAWHK